MSDTEQTNPRVVIDISSGEVKSITSDQPIDIVELNYDNDNYEETIRETKRAEDLQVMPADINEPTVVEEGAVFDNYSSEVDPDYVSEIYDFIGDSHRRTNFARTAKEFYDKMENDPDGDD